MQLWLLFKLTIVGCIFGWCLWYLLKSRIILRDDSRKWIQLEFLIVIIYMSLVCVGVDSYLRGFGFPTAFFFGIYYQTHRNYKDIL